MKWYHDKTISGGNRSICLRTDGAETLYDRSHHMCQSPICQQLKWQHIHLDLFLYNCMCCRNHTWTCCWICCIALMQKYHFRDPWLPFPTRKQAGTISVWPWHVRTTSADEPNVTCRVSGITRGMGSSIITSLMGLECSQSFMTVCFMALDLRAAMRRL